MPSAFAPCRACGKPVYVGAKRCPNCRAPNSWRSRLRSNVFPYLLLALTAAILVDLALDGWPEPTTHSGAPGDSQIDGLPEIANAAPTAAGYKRAPQSSPPSTEAIMPHAGRARSAAALPLQPDEPSITVRGRRIEPGMSADELFELIPARNLLEQTMEPEPGNPASLHFVKHYRIDNQDLVIELRKPGPKAPYAVSAIRLGRRDEPPRAAR